MPEALNFKNKKVLVFGLGLLGGGVATTNWLIKHGALVTVTDLKSEDYLEPSLKRLRGKPMLRLSGHDKRDIEANEIVVFNPDVSINNPFVRYARKIGRQTENEATIFYKLCPKPIIAVTGTRGKTTTANWIEHFLNSRYKTVVSGNSYAEPLLKTLDRAGRYSMVINEIPSFHLEYFGKNIKAPKIAVITNLYQDHLNRHKNMGNYALAKAAIFSAIGGNQSVGQHLILNHDNKWTPFFLKQKPKSKVYFFSLKPLPPNTFGAFYKNGKIFFRQENGKEVDFDVDGFVSKWGEHNLQNLLASSLAAHLSGVSAAQIQKRIKILPQVPFRQETVYENQKLKIINDTSATSPDGGVAAINRFAGRNTILITGGTDRQLDYKQWARIVARKLKKDNIIFLAGSATEKMAKELRIKNHELRIRETLKECLKEALKTAGKYPKSVILFSPAAKSFEKFKNEFDRGKQFNLLVKKLMRK